MKRFDLRVFTPIFSDNAGAGDAGDAGKGDSNTPPPAADGIKFDEKQQAHLNKLLKEERMKHQKTVQKTIDELNAIKTRADLSAKERSELEARIENMQSELLTKEELAAKERDRLKREYEGQVTNTTKERDYWKTKFTEETLVRAIKDEAVRHNAFDPEQIVAMLRSNTQLVETTGEDGKPNGTYVAKVKFSDVNAKGEPVTLDLGVSDAVKRMKEIERYFNLFKGEGTGGTGSLSRTPGKTQTLQNAAKDPETYRAMRKKQGL